MSFLVVNNNGLENTSYISSYDVLLSKFRKVLTVGNITSCKVFVHVSLTFSVIDETSHGGCFD